MLVGELSGEKVSDAKPKLKATLVAAGDGIIYSEPERAVVSRSGDTCVVALTDQWYLTYGEDEWAASARECLSGKRKREKKREREWILRGERRKNDNLETPRNSSKNNPFKKQNFPFQPSTRTATSAATPSIIPWAGSASGRALGRSGSGRGCRGTRATW